jgi:ABC-type glycerol-3-phosphate transport system substrate-binding protein
LKKIRILLGLGLILGLLLVSCERLPIDIPGLLGDNTTPTVPTALPGEKTPTPQVTTTISETPAPATELTIWVPPEMDPTLETGASQLFANQLQIFSETHGDLEIHVRVKAESGVSGLLNSLTATSSSAPDALPDLIVLSRSDLEMAALKGLIFALDGLTEIPDDPNWYPFAKEMALLQGSTFGLPFAGDALAMVYRPSNLPDFSGEWGYFVEENMTLTFAAGSDLALWPLALYQSEGGTVQDNQRRPTLEVEPLTEILRIIREGVDSNVFPQSLMEYQTDDQVWAAFSDGQTDAVITMISNFLNEGPADSSAMPLFAFSESTITIGTGLSWAVATPQSYRQPIAVELAEFLVEPEFLKQWTLEAGYIPPRPSALEGWGDQILRSTVSQVALTTRLRPSNDIMTSVAPILRDATQQILMNMMDPAQAALLAVESLEE